VSFDSLLQKYSAIVVLGMAAMAAYFHASGITDLLGAAVVGDSAAASAAVPMSAAPPHPSAATARNADPILSRNPFDSVTGPLNAKPVDPLALQPAQEAPISADPLGAAPCTDVRVTIVTESDDPTWSFAALQGGGEAKPMLRRVGDRIGSQQVAYIGFNPREGSPSVWLQSGTQLCQALLFGAPPPPPPGAAPGSGKPDPAAQGRGGAPALPPDIASKIHKISPTEYHVDRSVLDKIMENQATLMRSARIVPEQKDGKTVGIRLFGIRPDTLLGALGMQNGDRLEAINGFPMASPEKALEAYARLRTADKLTVQVNRSGAPVTIDIRIK
jgi:general secretion pathway protein C